MKASNNCSGSGIRKKSVLYDLLSQTEMVLVQLKDARTVYLGPCVVQSPSGWTRVGPTWLTPVGWVVIGPGAAKWGTKNGLAELATCDTARPKWHSIGVAVSPCPNIVFAVTKVALGSSFMKKVADLSRDAACGLENIG